MPPKALWKFPESSLGLWKLPAARKSLQVPTITADENFEELVNLSKSLWT